MTDTPETVTIKTDTIERVMNVLAQMPLHAVFEVFVTLKEEAEASAKAQKGE